MKKILILLLIPLSLFPIIVCAQNDNDNFKIEGSEFVWQRIFNTDLNFDDLLKEVRSRGVVVINNVDHQNSSIQAEFSEITPAVREAGFKDMSTPMYASRVTAFGNVSIDFKEGRYRVTVSRIKIAFMNTLEVFRNQNSYDWLAYYAVVDNKIDKKFLKRGSKIYNYTFIKMFNHPSKTTVTANDDW